MILAFSIFLVYLGIKALMTEDIQFVTTGKPGDGKGLDLVLFTLDIKTLVGIFALAYQIQSVLFGMMKSNKDQSKNSRDVGIAYILVFFFYSLLGVFGMFATAGLFSHQYGDGTLPGSITELLVRTNTFLSQTEYIIGCFAVFLIFTQLTTVIPVLCFFSRRQFFELIYGPKVRISRRNFHIFNVFFNLSCLAVEISGYSISKIIGVTGAVGGFLLVYIIPIYIHLKCLYFVKVENNALLLDVEGKNTKFNEKCKDHSNYVIQNKVLVYGFYTFLTMFGIAIMIAQLMDLF